MCSHRDEGPGIREIVVAVVIFFAPCNHDPCDSDTYNLRTPQPQKQQRHPRKPNLSSRPTCPNILHRRLHGHVAFDMSLLPRRVLSNSVVSEDAVLLDSSASLNTNLCVALHQASGGVPPKAGLCSAALQMSRNAACSSLRLAAGAMSEVVMEPAALDKALQ